MGLLRQRYRRRDVFVDLSLEILEFCGSCRGVTLEDNGRVFLGKAVQTELFIDVYRHLRDELGKLLGEMVMIGTSMDDKVSVQKDISDCVLGEHTFNGTTNDLIRMTVHKLSHGYFL